MLRFHRNVPKRGYTAGSCSARLMQQVERGVNVISMCTVVDVMILVVTRYWRLAKDEIYFTFLHA